MTLRHEAGFALLEVLVAFVAAALVVAITLGGLVEARHRQAGDRDQTQATLLAARLMAETACDAAPAGSTVGEAGGLAWQRRVSRFADPGTSPGPLALRDITISIRRGNTEILALATRRLDPNGCTP